MESALTIQLYMKSNRITKEGILAEITPRDIFSHYIGKPIKLGKVMKSPLRERDKHPSFNIYKSPSGQVMYKDFAVESGDCFDFVMRMYNISFVEALQRIANDFNIGQKGTDISSLMFRKKKVDLIEESIEKTEFNFSYFDNTKINEIELLSRYYSHYGINKYTLNYYPVRAVKDVQFISKQGNNIFVPWNDDQPLFMYDYGFRKHSSIQVVRFYRPNQPKNGLKHFGNVGRESIFGITNINSELIKDTFDVTGMKTVVICAGQKDAMCVHSNFGLYAIALSSESSHLSSEQWLMLKETFGEDCTFVSLYDNDKTGAKYANILHDNYGIKPKLISSINDSCNDISEFIFRFGQSNNQYIRNYLNISEII